AFHGEDGLHQVRSAQSTADALDGGYRLRTRQRRDRRRFGEEIRIADYVLLLRESIKALCGERVADAEPVIKESESNADHSRLFRSLRARSPCYADPRSEVAMIVDVCLRFVAQAQAPSHVRAHPPVIGDKPGGIHLTSGDLGCSRADAELRR